MPSEHYTTLKISVIKTLAELCIFQPGHLQGTLYLFVKTTAEVANLHIKADSLVF
jgi:hypothetical protein